MTAAAVILQSEFKICVSGGVLRKGDLPGRPQYTLEEMHAIAEEAHKLGRKIAAHAIQTA